MIFGIKIYGLLFQVKCYILIYATNKNKGENKMASLNTKFNVGNTAFIIHDNAELDEADYGDEELFDSIYSGIRSIMIESIIFDKDGIKYCSEDGGIYPEDELFGTIKEAFTKVITDLKNHLEENLERTVSLIKDAEENFDYYLKNSSN